MSILLPYIESKYEGVICCHEYPMRSVQFYLRVISIVLELFPCVTRAEIKIYEFMLLSRYLLREKSWKIHMFGNTAWKNY